MTKIKKHSIKSLYPLALAEGEGVGTAYEYFAKRLHLIRWLKEEKPLRRILIAGLPEKYGSSLDFMLLASEFKASVTIADERPSALEKAKTALSAAQANGCLDNLEPDFHLVDSMGSMVGLDNRFDLILTSETLQRLASDERALFIIRLLRLAPLVAVFAPNDDNPAHTSQSGLSGLHLAELEQLVKQSVETQEDPNSQISIETDYIDMPPFPPGITRTEEQREHATSGTGEAIAMWGLGYYARLEGMIPIRWRRSKAHIVFALIDNSQR